MYFNHTELKGIIADLIEPGGNSDRKFNPDDQISVCSVDLLVDNVFFKRKKGRFGIRQPIDLAKTSILRLSPWRHWKKSVLRESEFIALKPGEMILGRTHEKICMPKELVGKINTRSSYARLGLSTACNCDLVNPGYNGHVPLELTNVTSGVIQIRPYIPLVQLFVMPLHGGAGGAYGDEKFKSKYQDDEGTPSEWWRDDLVKVVESKVSDNNNADAVLEDLREKFDEIDYDGLSRLENFLNRKRFSNAEEVLDSFQKSEFVRSIVDKTIKGGSYLLATVFFGLTIKDLFFDATTVAWPPNILQLSIWGIFLVSSGIAYYFRILAPEKKFYTRENKGT